MKKLLTIAGLAMVLFSCKTGTTNSPKGTVDAFIEASKTGNLDELKKYVTSSDASLMAMGESFISKLDSAKAREMKEKMSSQFKEKTKDAKIEIKDEVVTGDNATVNVEFTHDGKSETHPFSLVKEDGQWKVSLISTGMKNSGASQHDMEAMKNLNLDSLKGVIGDGMKEGMKEFDKINKDSLKQVIDEAMKGVNKTTRDSIKKAMEQGMKELEKLKDIPKQ